IEIKKGGQLRGEGFRGAQGEIIEVLRLLRRAPGAGAGQTGEAEDIHRGARAPELRAPAGGALQSGAFPEGGLSRAPALLRGIIMHEYPPPLPMEMREGLRGDIHAPPKEAAHGDPSQKTGQMQEVITRQHVT